MAEALLRRGKYEEAVAAAQAAIEQLNASPDSADAALLRLRRRGLVCIIVKARLRCKTFSEAIQHIKPLREMGQEDQAQWTEQMAQWTEQMAALEKELSDTERPDQQTADATHSSARVLPAELLLLVESLVIHADLLDALGRIGEAAERCEWLFTVLHLMSTACPTSTAGTSSENSVQDTDRDGSTRDHRYEGASAVVENVAFMPAYH